VPPVAVIVWLYGVPSVALGRVVGARVIVTVAICGSKAPIEQAVMERGKVGPRSSWLLAPVGKEATQVVGSPAWKAGLVLVMACVLTCEPSGSGVVPPLSASGLRAGLTPVRSLAMKPPPPLGSRSGCGRGWRPCP